MRKGMTYLEELRGEYEQSVSATSSQANWLRVARTLELFFKCFPKRKDPAEFYPCDAISYRTLRLEAGLVPQTVRTELSYVGAFFRWLREVKLLPVLDPTSQLNMSSRTSRATDQSVVSMAFEAIAALARYTGGVFSDALPRPYRSNSTEDIDKLLRAALFRLAFFYSFTAKEIRYVRRENFNPQKQSLDTHRRKSVQVDAETTKLIQYILERTSEKREYPLRPALDLWPSFCSEARVLPIPSLGDLRRAGIDWMTRDLGKLQFLAALIQNKSDLRGAAERAMEQAPEPEALRKFVESLPEELHRALARRLALDESLDVVSEQLPATSQRLDVSSRQSGPCLLQPPT